MDVGVKDPQVFGRLHRRADRVRVRLRHSGGTRRVDDEGHHQGPQRDQHHQRNRPRQPHQRNLWHKRSLPHRRTERHQHRR